MDDAERQQLLDGEHLRLLRLGYLVGGFTNVAWALFPMIHVTLGSAMLLGLFPHTGADQPPRFVGLFFVLFGGALSLLFATAATLKLMTARRLRERRSRTFCLIVAAVSCLGIPYGTFLGAATVMVLSRPSVEAQFDRAGAVEPAS